MEEPAEKTGMRNAWNRVAVAYDDFWSERTLPYTERGLDLLDPPAGGRGLDVGCGPGHTALALRRRMAGGSVLGVDFAPGMVERARESRGGEGVEFALDDAERLSLPDAGFDVVTSSYALMYCYDAIGALGQMARVLRPGGRLMVAVWGRAPEVWWSPVIELIESRAAYYSAVCPMMFFYGLPGVLARMAEQVGLRLERGEPVELGMPFSSTEEAVEAAILGGPLAGLFVNRLSPEHQAEVREALAAHAETLAEREGDGIALPGASFVAVASRPA